MKKSIGPDKVKTAVFVSGTGSNLKNLIKFSFKKNSPIAINLIISNKSDAKGLKYANQQKIEKKIINFISPKESEKKIINLLAKKKISFICLAGFMKVLSNNFLKKFNGKIVNMHPSLLPKYKGLDTHKRVLKNNEKFSGCTVHYVTSKLDSGKIILQKKIKIGKTDKENTLRKKILREEHRLYPRAIKKIFD
jgi:formyltetrahydrofolate-dependent phosphoribosylglycinamide formyltransferase